MGYWHWGPELELGIDVIDSQHRRIVDYINQLHDAKIKDDHGRIGEVLDELVDYTLTHFAFEESMMAQGGYPLTEPHKQVHDRFTQQIHRYREQHQSGADVANELLGALRVWLTNHIQRDDRDYVVAVNHTLRKPEANGWLGKTLARFFG